MNDTLEKANGNLKSLMGDEIKINLGNKFAVNIVISFGYMISRP